MTFSLADLLTPKTRDEVLAEMLSLADTFGLPTTAWGSGSVVRQILTLLAQKLADVSVVVVGIAGGGFGDFVSTAQAPLWAKQTFDVDIIEAEAATGAITATNASLTNYTLNPGELIVAHATTGKLYRNQALITIPASGSLADIAIAADETGTGSDAAPGTITVLVSNQVGVTITNPAAVLGADLETKTHLVARARSKLGFLSPMGAKDVYNFVATTPSLPDGTILSDTSTPITRTLPITNIATGQVTVYLATADGAPSGGDVTIVQAAYDKYAEPWTANAVATAATEHPINVTYQVWVQNTSLTSLQIQALIEAALAVYMSLAPIGGYVVPPDAGDIYVEEISGVIRGATVGIVRVSVTVPAADVTLLDSEVPTLGAVTPTVTLI